MNTSKTCAQSRGWILVLSALLVVTVAAAGGCAGGVGGWSQIADPPFKNREEPFAAALGDGRVLVWGGAREADGRCFTTGVQLIGLGDGGIYDPATNTWEYISPSPLRPVVPGPATFMEVQLAHGRLAVAELYEDGSVHAAVYDVAEQRWHEAPSPEITIWEALGWDGQTLTVVDRSAKTVRWTLGSPMWTSGAPFPLAARSATGSAFDGRRLAVWGGWDSAGGFLDEGAVYDVQTDTWQVMSAGPLTARVIPGMMWSQGKLLVGGGLDRRDEDRKVLSDLVAYDPVSDAWATLASAPDGGPIANRRSIYSYAEGNEPLLITWTLVMEAVIKPQWFLGPAGWELAPQPDVHRLGDQVIATSNVVFNSGPGSFSVAVRGADGAWEAGRSASFKNRAVAAIATSAGRLYVTNGCERTGEGTNMHLAEGAWAFDPAKSG